MTLWENYDPVHLMALHVFGKAIFNPGPPDEM